MRVVHLIDSGMWSEGGAPASSWRPADPEMLAVRVLVQMAEVEQRVVLLGTAAAARRALRLGLACDLVLCPPLGRPSLAWRMLRGARALAATDLIHCWSPGAAGLIRRSLGREADFVGARDLPAPFEIDRRDKDERAAVRAAFGIPDGALVILLLGRGDDADALRFSRVVGALEYAGLDVVGVAPAWARQLSRGRSFVRRFGPRIRVVVAEAPARDVLPGCDLAIWDRCAGTAPGESISPSWWIGEAHSAGVPVVAARGPELEGLHPASAQACLAHNKTIPEMVRTILELMDAPGQLQTMAAEVRQHQLHRAGPRALVAAAMKLWLGGARAKAEGRLEGLETRKSVA